MTRILVAVFMSAQAELCRKCLVEEIEMMKPDATVFLTSNYAEGEILYPALGGSDSWFNNVKDEDRVAVKRHPTLGLMLWGGHPSRKGTLYKAEVGNFIAGYVAGSLSQRASRHCGDE